MLKSLHELRAAPRPAWFACELFRGVVQQNVLLRRRRTPKGSRVDPVPFSRPARDSFPGPLLARAPESLRRDTPSADSRPAVPFLAAVCTCLLSACTTGTVPKEPEPIPAELIPPGYSAADCRITEPGGAITETGPDGRPMTVGERKPTVQCHKHDEGQVTMTSTPVCYTKRGKELPLSDCCMNPDGSKIPSCEPKLQPVGE